MEAMSKIVFLFKDTLIDHFKTHTKERPFVCNVCEKGFTQKSALKTQRLQHISNKPYICKTCGDVFASRMLLKAHKCVNVDLK